jgi:hypothetical protein
MGSKHISSALLGEMHSDATAREGVPVRRGNAPQYLLAESAPARSTAPLRSTLLQATLENEADPTLENEATGSLRF